MNTTHLPDPDRALATAHAEVKAEIARVDTKTGLLLAFDGAVLAATWTAARVLPMNTPAYVAGGLGTGLLLAAASLLLTSVRPALGQHGVPLWATLTADEIRTTVTGADLAADIAGLSRMAVAKFTALRRAVDLIRTGGTLLVLAALLVAAKEWVA